MCINNITYRHKRLAWQEANIFRRNWKWNMCTTTCSIFWASMPSSWNTNQPYLQRQLSFVRRRWFVAQTDWRSNLWWNLWSKLLHPPRRPALCRLPLILQLLTLLWIPEKVQSSKWSPGKNNTGTIKTTPISNRIYHTIHTTVMLPTS